MKTLYNRRIHCGYAVPERLCAVGCRDTRGIEKVFTAPRDAVQRTAVPAGGDLFICFLRLRKSQVGRQRNDAAQLRIETLDTVEIDLREPFRLELALLNPAGELSDGCESDVFILGRKRAWIRLAPDELIA